MHYDHLHFQFGEFCSSEGQHSISIPVPFKPIYVWHEITPTHFHHCGGGERNQIAWIPEGNAIEFVCDIYSPHIEVHWFCLGEYPDVEFGLGA